MLGFGDKATSGGEANPDIFDVTDAEFMTKVVEESRRRPVIVDFWAPWCGPCKTLGPALEKAVVEAGGKVALAKVDIDQNPHVAQQLRVQSIPAVYAFIQGQAAPGFVGAVPTSELKRFVEEVIKAAGGAPGEDDLGALLEAADAALAEGALADAAQAYAAVFQADPTEVRALAGLARCYAAGGDIERAKQTLAMAPEDKAADPALTAARAAIELAEQGAEAARALSQNQSAVNRDPNDHQARFDLALGLVAAGRREQAVDELLELFRRDREWNDGAAKTQLLKFFDAFGAADPLTVRGRRRLSSIIFS